MKLNCSTCIDDVARGREADSMTLIMLKNRGGLKTPSELIYKVCLIAERVIRSLLCSGGLVTNFPEVARLHSLAKVQDEGVISSLTCSEHAISVVREVLTRYVRIRSHHEAVLKTDAKSLIRSKMNRLPIFSNL